MSATDISVLVTGESGVGKENIPRIIHQNSPRKRGKYFAINCGAIPEGTIDSELFGHEKGAFTGAVSRRIGRAEAANGGTLFLDEIGELGLDEQAMLLRAIEEKKFFPLGSDVESESSFDDSYTLTPENLSEQIDTEYHFVNVDVHGAPTLWGLS